jgi:SanA protein
MGVEQKRKGPITSEGTGQTAVSGRKNRGCCWWSLLLLLFAVSFPWSWRWAIQTYYAPHIYTVDDVGQSSLLAADAGVLANAGVLAEKPVRVAIVYGAAVRPGGRLSAVLHDRMETAVALYEAGYVDKLLVSGDNRTADYNEPAAMLAYALARGVDPADVQPDYAGLRTYDTCYRARHIFGVETAVLVTQEFHLPRALFTCRNMGIEAIGVASDLRPYSRAQWFEIRETGATLMALWDVVKYQPATILGEPIPFE